MSDDGSQDIMRFRSKPGTGDPEAFRAWIRWRSDLLALGQRPCGHCHHVLEVRFFRYIAGHKSKRDRGYSAYCMSCEAARQRDWQHRKKALEATRDALAEQQAAMVEPQTGIIGASDAASSLHRLTGKALKTMEMILDLPMPARDDSNYVKIIAEKRQTASAILAGQIRVDENMLRHRSDDTMKKLLDTIEGKAKVAGLLN